MALHKGDRFNESVAFADAVTSKLSRRLTQFRDFNQTPTYHLNACFSADSRYLVMASWDAEGDSCLLRAEVATGEITVLAALPRASGEDYNGNNVSLIQASQWVAANTGKTLRLCHLETLEERVLLDLSGTEQRFGHPIGSLDGTKVFIPRMTKRVIPGETKDVSVTHLEVEIASGATRELFFDEGRACNHLVPNPVDPDLLLIDRDLPPKFAHGGDGGQTSRVWVLNRVTGAVTEIRPRDPPPLPDPLQLEQHRRAGLASRQVGPRRALYRRLGRDGPLGVRALVPRVPLWAHVHPPQRGCDDHRWPVHLGPGDQDLLSRAGRVGGAAAGGAGAAQLGLVQGAAIAPALPRLAGRAVAEL